MQLTVLKSLDAVIQACWFHQFPVNRSKKENYNCYRMSDKDFSKGCMFLSFAFVLAIIRALCVATTATTPSILFTEMFVCQCTEKDSLAICLVLELGYTENNL